MTADKAPRRWVVREPFPTYEQSYNYEMGGREPKVEVVYASAYDALAAELIREKNKVQKLMEQRNEHIQRNCSSNFDFPRHANAEARYLIIEADKELEAIDKESEGEK